MTEDGTRLPSQPVSATLFLVVLTLAGAISFTGVLMVSPLLLDLAKEFETSVAVTGQLVSAGALTWALLAPVCGVLSDRYGRKPLLLIGLVTFATFTLLSSWANDLPSLFAGRILSSIGGAFVATNLQTSVADYFPPQQRGRALGWVISGFSLSPLVGVPVVALVAEISDWRWSFRLIAVLLLAIAAVIHKVVPRARPQLGGKHNVTFSSLYRNRSVAGLLTCNMFERLMYGAITTYLAAFLMQRYRLSVGEVAPVISLVAVGTLVGTLLGGRLTGRGNPVTAFVAAQATAGLTLLPLMLLGPAVWISGLVAACFGAFNSFSRPSYMLMVTQVSVRIRGTMMGLNVMANQLGFMLGAALGGLVIAVGGYSELGLLSCGAGLLAALACRLLVEPDSLTRVGMEQGTAGDA